MDISKILSKALKLILSPQIIVSVLIVIGAFTLWFLIKRMAAKFKARNGGEQSTVLQVTMSVLKALVAVITVLIVLQINGINIGSMVAGLGLVSAAVGLALQDTLKDVVMGLHIMGDKFFSVGDPVEYNGVSGIVTSFNVRTTKIESVTDNSTLSVCNRNISEIKKMTDMLDIDVPISYDEDVRKVHKTFTEIAEKISEIDGVSSCVYKGTQSFESSAVLYKIRLYCDYKRRCDIRRAAISKIQVGLESSNIKIPFDQLDVHNV